MTLNKPIIGITLDNAVNGAKLSYSPKPWYALRKCYSRILEEKGAIPILLPYNEDIDSLIDLIDGLLIPGGDDDINPELYGEKINSKYVNINDPRASFELKLIAKAKAKKIPVFGICNGMQIMNVFYGGTLYQHLPDEYKTDIEHAQKVPSHIATHEIIIDQNSELGKIAKTERVMVNSTHHQAIKKLGPNLIVSASADDGIIEGIEDASYPFMVGVEWHPEHLNSELDHNLFKEFIEYAKNYKTNK